MARKSKERERRPPRAERKWPAYVVERKPISWLKPYERNARTHSEAQIEQLRGSLRKFGWTNPVLAREDGTIIAGHGRIEAGKREGLTECPVIIARGWSEQECREYALADNRIPLNSDWDEKLLGIELAELKDLGVDLQALGFKPVELNDLIEPKVGNTDPDDVPDAPTVPISRPGDLWVLGRHRLLCGDSTKREDVDRVLNGVKPHLMVTDPPYGVKYDPTWREGHDMNLGKGFDGFGARAKGKVANDDRVDWRECWALFPGSIAYVWHAGVYASSVQASLEAVKFEMRAQIIWAKQHFVFGRGDYHWQHEPCWYAVRGKGNWAGDRKQTTLWQINNNNPFGSGKEKEKKTGHGTQKPVECMKRPIENNSSPGQAVYEPFSGSGTTIIAGEMTGRSVLAIEIDPAYVDVAVNRWQEFAGLKATDENGRAFDEVAAERVKEAA